MRLTILKVAKKTNDYIDEIEDYKSKINYLSKLKIEEINIQHSNKKEESVLILSKIKSHDYVVLLDERGSQIDSVCFADFINNRMSDSVTNIVFVIGGSYGVEEEIRERANYIISFGKMVWPHRLVYIMLLEQIYRGFNILHNTEYHHK